MDTSEIISNQKHTASDIYSGVSNTLVCSVSLMHLENIQNMYQKLKTDHMWQVNPGWMSGAH